MKTSPQERLLSMPAAARLLGLSARRCRERMLEIEAQRGDTLIKIKNRYYTTESALREIIPRAFAASAAQEGRIEEMEEQVASMRQTIQAFRTLLHHHGVRIRALESHNGRNRPEPTEADE